LQNERLKRNERKKEKRNTTGKNEEKIKRETNKDSKTQPQNNVRNQ
jgi:hypothetical protein